MSSLHAISNFSCTNIYLWIWCVCIDNSWRWKWSCFDIKYLSAFSHYCQNPHPIPEQRSHSREGRVQVLPEFMTTFGRAWVYMCPGWWQYIMKFDCLAIYVNGCRHRWLSIVSGGMTQYNATSSLLPIDKPPRLRPCKCIRFCLVDETRKYLYKSKHKSKGTGFTLGIPELLYTEINILFWKSFCVCVCVCEYV